ncbi:sodium:proton exchanger [Nibricoccus aquaticus]|uniref:Sodium:proton exchanger n=1 Tax=Nibricoccus aquaticus TaxID=2576891 RepID=A0A290Q478_9BACT|nr:cation:proton antiporter [Nibricoccus aquaticus]ATC63475.1 sodium:proton exchanger [Nibricoccus aquaticus]
MPHDISLITTIAFGFTAALFFGLIAKRCGLSPIVGYLIAGIAAGPHTPGFVGDAHLAPQLAEIGVILLMFGVGLHFHLKDLLAVRSIAIPGALGQSIAATVVSMVIAMACGWSWSAGLVLGIATAVASTVVLLRVLMDNNVLETTSGHVAVGWLIVEDLITVLVLVLLPAFAIKEGVENAGGFLHILQSAGWAVLKLAILVALVAIAGAKFVPWLLHRVAALRSRELFTLSILVMSIAVATAAYKAFDASMALGAFLAGMMVGQSKFSHQAAAEALPMRDAFAVLFFVSVGMLFDFRVVIDQPWLVAGVTAVILIVKPLTAFLIVLLCRHTVRTGLMVAGGLAQIGEFSFILADVAKAQGLLPGESSAVLVAGAIISISINPVFFRGLMALEPWIERHGSWMNWLTKRSEVKGAAINSSLPAEKKEGIQAIVVGHGPVGETVSRLLREFDIEPMIIETNIDTVAELRAQGHSALFGDATRPDILKEAAIKTARYLVLTIPDAIVRQGVIATARELNPHIRILTRARYLAERDSLKDAGVSVICFDEAEAAAGLAEGLLADVGVPTERVNQEVLRIRAELGSVVKLENNAAAAHP